MHIKLDRDCFSDDLRVERSFGFEPVFFGKHLM